MDAVIFNVNSRPQLTTTISRTSAGALELMDVFTVRDNVSFLTQAKAQGVELIAADCDSSFKYPNTTEIARYKRREDSNVMLVLGSEGAGISNAIKQLCDRAIHISKGKGASEEFPYSLIDSLNVAVSSGILLKKIINK